MRTVRDMSKNDEIWTPPEAIDPLLPYIPKFIGHENYHHTNRIWEMCPGQFYMLAYLQSKGFFTVDLGNRSSLIDAPIGWDMIVTNPPWSKKHLFLERCVALGKPFALLLPVRTLGVRRCQVLLDDCDFLFLPRRIDYTGGNSPYEASFWVTRGLLPDRVIFAPLETMNA